MKRWAAEQAAHRVRAVKAVANDIEVQLSSSDDRSDADIAAAAVRAIEWDSELPSDKIKVTVENGWVTLRGEVEWQFQRVDAERVVRRLKGVQGVTNFVVVSPRVTPSNVKSQIEDALVRSVKTDAQHITVEADEGHVVLKGEVRSYAERDEAERAAWMAPGVKSVENKIIVSYS
jgi:osmotically-inducible protein OsmY